MRQFTAGPNEEGVRLSRFVLRVTQNLPSSVLYKSFRTRRIKVNGKKAEPDARLAEGDVVALYLNDEFFPSAAPWPAKAAFAPLPPASFETVWQNKAIAILYKPEGVPCHSGAPGVPSLLEAFTASLIQIGEYEPQTESSFAPALCNRIDQGTEGLVAAAKTYPALRDMNQLIRLNLVAKNYLCITVGTPPTGELQAHLVRNKATHTVTVSARPAPGSKPIATGVNILARKTGYSLCEIALLTGRNHQIRAHLAFLGAPLLGDKKYGDARANRQHPLASQALCAWKLAFAPNLPPENTLAGLAGREFTAETARLPAYWASLAE
ncbi:MAG: RluA family pseudouridine synthase [Oscillospiraceae bacterium]